MFSSDNTFRFRRTTEKPRRSQAAFLKVAKKLRADSLEEASGRCLYLSLEMAKVAQARRLEVDLVVWSVAGDPNFLDHWAVAISPNQVIDLTRVQVDGLTGLLYDIDDYPANFLRRRRYPASALLPALAGQGQASEGQFDAGFVWRVRWLMFRHDLRRSRLLRRAAIGWTSSLSLAKFGVLHTARRVEGTLQARRDTLVERMRDRASRPVSIRPAR